MERCKKTKYNGLPREVIIDDQYDLDYILRAYPQARIRVKYICEKCGRSVKKDIRYLKKEPFLLCRGCIQIKNRKD